MQRRLKKKRAKIKTIHEHAIHRLKLLARITSCICLLIYAGAFGKLTPGLSARPTKPTQNVEILSTLTHDANEPSLIKRVQTISTAQDYTV
jgi:hypothetical protein